MPTYWIYNCDEKEFNAYAFKIGQGKTEQVEGRYWKLSYYPQGTAQANRVNSRSFATLKTR